MEHRKSKRSLRVALVLGAAVAGTAVVGWGGLAAWSAYTENAGNSVAAGTLAHANGTSCVSLLGNDPSLSGHRLVRGDDHGRERRPGYLDEHQRQHHHRQHRQSEEHVHAQPASRGVGRPLRRPDTQGH